MSLDVGSLVVPPGLNDQIKHLALIVHGASEIHAPSADLADHLVQMPARGGRWPPALQVPGDLRGELDRPTPDGFVADVDAPLNEHLLDVRKLNVKRKYSHTA